MITRKLVKTIRKFRWLYRRSNSIPLHWHVGRPNFGDDINPLLYSALMGRPIHFVRRNQPHVMGIGSILDSANATSVVAGSGLLFKDAKIDRAPAGILAVRGKQTAHAIEHTPPLLGDPAILVDRLFPHKLTGEFPLGLIPHITQVAKYKPLARQGLLVIDPAWPPLRVLAAICRCQKILSQSLHGLIVADAYEIPNAWVSPSDSMLGGSFKFHDYFSTTEQAKKPLDSSKLQHLLQARDLEFFVSRYRYDKQEYVSRLQEQILEFLEQVNPGQHDTIGCRWRGELNVDCCQ